MRSNIQKWCVVVVDAPEKTEYDPVGALGVDLGIENIAVDSDRQSRQCPKCKYIDQRNRKSRNEFECLQCGFKGMADYVGALNIKNRVPVNEPMVAPLFPAVTSPHASAVGS